MIKKLYIHSIFCCILICTNLYSQHFKFNIVDSTISPYPKSRVNHYPNNHDATILLIESDILPDNTHLNIISNLDIVLNSVEISPFKKLFCLRDGNYRLSIIVEQENKYNYSSIELPKKFYGQRDSIFIKIKHIPRKFSFHEIKKPDARIPVSIASKEKVGVLEIQTEVPDVFIYINGEQLLQEKTTIPDLYRFTFELDEPDSCEIIFSADGYYEIQKKMFLAPRRFFYGKIIDIGYQDSVIISGSTLTINSIPSGASIFINGLDSKLITPMNFKFQIDQPIKIKLRKNRYYIYKEEIIISQRDTVLNCVLKKKPWYQQTETILIGGSLVGGSILAAVASLVKEDKMVNKNKYLIDPPIFPNH